MTVVGKRPLGMEKPLDPYDHGRLLRNQMRLIEESQLRLGHAMAAQKTSLDFNDEVNQLTRGLQALSRQLIQLEKAKTEQVEELSWEERAQVCLEVFREAPMEYVTVLVKKLSELLPVVKHL